MSVCKTSPTSWDREYAMDGYQIGVDEIVATHEGLEICGDLLPWIEIDAARKALENEAGGHSG